jgi:hypothetical protein
MNCSLGHLSLNRMRVLCIHKGVVDPDFSCRKYHYNPLKRVPMRMPSLPAFEKDDFKL